MKKLIATMMVGFVAASYGSVNVNWTAGAGFYFNGTGAGILGDGAGGSTIAQLMYSVDAIQDAGNVATGINTSGLGVGNDVLWDSLIITENSVLGDFDEYASFPATQNYQQSFVSGYVYALIFQDSVIDANDWYFYTPMLALTDIVGATPPQGIQMNTDLINGNAIDSGATVAQVVPEPATALLFGMGAMGAWLIRRNKIKSKEAADA